MPHPNSIDVTWPIRTLEPRAEDGSAIVELVAWLALIAAPVLALCVYAVRFETAFSVVQNLAREVSRENALGLDVSPAITELAADFGLSAADFDIRSECVAADAAGTCQIQKTSVKYRPLGAVPTAVALMGVNG